MAENSDRLRQLAAASITVEQVDAVVREWRTFVHTSPETKQAVDAIRAAEGRLWRALTDLERAWQGGAP